MKKTKLPTYSNSTKLAGILTEKFERLVTPSAISRALRDEGMIGKQGNGSWRVADAISWWETHRAGQGEDFARLMAESNIAEMRKKISDAKKSRLEADRVEKEQSGKWGLVSSMKSAMTGLAATVAGFWDRFAEEKDGVRKIVREAALRCGAAEEFIARLDAELANDLLKANDELKKQFGKEGETAMERFETARRQELKNQQ